MLCREHLLQLQQQQDELEAYGVQVVVVTFEGGPAVKAYVRQTKLRWPILLDPSRSLYRAYGMERGRSWAILGPASWGSYIKLLLRGRRLHRPTGDVHQLGGDVLIDPQGAIRLHHVSIGPADRPSVLSILEIVRRHAPVDPGQTPES